MTKLELLVHRVCLINEGRTHTVHPQQQREAIAGYKRFLETELKTPSPPEISPWLGEDRTTRLVMCQLDLHEIEGLQKDLDVLSETC